MRHIISILLQNEAGALARVAALFSTRGYNIESAALFSTRGYNIESLNVAPTEHPEISRLTLVTTGSDEVIDQINKQLLKLVDVVNTADMTMDDELLLMKVRVNAGAEGEVTQIVEAAGGRVLDDSPETYTVELTGANERIDDFIARLGACSEILAVVRSGAMAIARGQNVLGANF
jgi:acetolactate synthase-1/3 small subunit